MVYGRGEDGGDGVVSVDCGVGEIVGVRSWVEVGEVSVVNWVVVGVIDDGEGGIVDYFWGIDDEFVGVGVYILDLDGVVVRFGDDFVFVVWLVEL